MSLAIQAEAALELRRRLVGLRDIRPATDDELHTAIEAYTGVRVPDRAVCDGHVSPFRALADAYFARSRLILWKASRGFGGKSVLLAILSMLEATTLGASVSLLGGSGEQSQRVHGYMTGEDPNMPETFWGAPGAPRYLLASDPTKRETRLTNGGLIKVLMASSRSVRGPHPQRLRLDEADEIEQDVLDAALGQAMSVYRDDLPDVWNGELVAQTVVSSTHQYADGTMTEMLRRSREVGWPVYEWCFRETSAQPGGWLAASEVEAKRLEVPQSMWATEYELLEPAPETRAIQPGAVADMFDASLGEVQDEPGQEYIFEEPAHRARIYATGADWARKRDWTVIVTWRTDTDPWRLVAYERTRREDWPVMVRKFNDRVTRFPGLAAHDATGLGDVVDGFLEVDADPVILAGRTRADIFSEYIAACERREVVCPRIAFLEQEHRYASVDDVYGRGHPPDGFVAMALALYAIGARTGSWADVADLGHVDDYVHRFDTLRASDRDRDRDRDGSSKVIIPGGLQ